MRHLVLTLWLVGCATTQTASTCPPSTAASTQPAKLDPAQKEADIRKLLEVTGSARLARQMLDHMIESFRTQLPSVPGEFWDRFISEVDVNQFVDMVVPVYMKRMSHDAIFAALQFFESAPGRKFSAETVPVAAESQRIGERWGSIISAQAIEKMRDSGYAQSLERSAHTADQD
jgi:hypothetical protein